MKKAIIVVGPTAVGKTSLAIQLAEHFHTAVISADSRQCFRELSVGVARPSAEDLNRVPHYFIGTHTVNEEVNAALFEAYALKKTQEIFRDQDVVILAGGTGLYVKAFCEGMDPIPGISHRIKEDILHRYQQEGIEYLQRELQDQDPLFWKQAEQKNPHRLMRALGVFRSTGQSIVTFRTERKSQRDFQIIKIGLELPRDILNEQIRRRTELMMQQGLLEEVRELLPFRGQNALQTVGYKELFAYLDGNDTLEQAVAAIKINTRQYAKRQMTWFKKDPQIHWLDARYPPLDAGLRWVREAADHS